MKTYMGFLAIVLTIFAAGVGFGWLLWGSDQPVGGMPTAAMQMAAPEEIEAGQTATPPATEPIPTSTAAPTRQQPTSTPTATATPQKEEWEIDCSVRMVGRAVECMDLVTRGSKEPGVARLYWVGECLPNNIIYLWKQGVNNIWREVQRGIEWNAEFVPNECSRATESPSPNHIVLNTLAGPGTYRISVRAGGDDLLLKTFFWNAPAASAPTPSATTTTEPTVMPTPVGAMAETATPIPSWMEWVSPFDYGGVCIYDVRLDGNYYWVSQNSDWSLWDTAPYGDGGFFVLGLDEVTGQVRWLVGDPTDPCIEGGQLAGVAGLESYLRGIGREDLFIPPPPAVGDLD